GRTKPDPTALQVERGGGVYLSVQLQVERGVGLSVCPAAGGGWGYLTVQVRVERGVGVYLSVQLQ
ncbi:hypothetical protein KUCAC02_011210, partial [Chaenocephalus aceratus]